MYLYFFILAQTFVNTNFSEAKILHLFFDKIIKKLKYTLIKFKIDAYTISSLKLPSPSGMCVRAKEVAFVLVG